MKKQLITAVALSAALCLAGCGSGITPAATQAELTAEVTTAETETTAPAETTAETEQPAGTEAPAQSEDTEPAAEASSAADSVAVEAAVQDQITVTDIECKKAYSTGDPDNYCLYRGTVPCFACSAPDETQKQNLDALNAFFRKIEEDEIADLDKTPGYVSLDFDTTEKVVNEHVFGNRQITVGYSLQNQNDKVCSVMMYRDEFSGGAHGFTVPFAYVVDYTQMKLVTLAELSASPDELRDFAVGYFMEHYAERYDGKTDWNADYLKSALDGRNEYGAWYFADGKFCLEFPAYSFDAAYFEGPQLLKIPVADCLPHFSDYGKQLFQ